MYVGRRKRKWVMLSFSMSTVGNVPQVLHFSPKRTLTRAESQREDWVSKGRTKQKEEVVSNTDVYHQPLYAPHMLSRSVALLTYYGMKIRNIHVPSSTPYYPSGSLKSTFLSPTNVLIKLPIQNFCLLCKLYLAKWELANFISYRVNPKYLKPKVKNF